MGNFRLAIAIWHTDMSDIIPPVGATFRCALGAWQVHERGLRGYLMHRLGDRYLSDDLLQETPPRAMRQGEGFCAISRPRAWLASLAVRRRFQA